MHLKSRKLGGPGRPIAAALLPLFIIGLAGFASAAQPTKPGKPAFDKNSPFYFDGTISRQTLENYLDRAITMGYFLVPGRPQGYQFPYRDDDVRMIHPSFLLCQYQKQNLPARLFPGRNHNENLVGLSKY
jgi:hypothetical protein